MVQRKRTTHLFHIRELSAFGIGNVGRLVAVFLRLTLQTLEELENRP
jgi:hypothetical protein